MTRTAITLCSLLLLLPACKQEASPTTQPPGAPAAQTAPVGKPAGPAVEKPGGAERAPRPVAPIVEKPKAAGAYADALLTQMRKRQAAEASFKENLRKGHALDVARLPRFRKHATRAYKAHAGLFTSDGEELTDDGQVAIDLILDVESHGLDASSYNHGMLKSAITRYSSARDALKTARQSLIDADPTLGRLLTVLREFVRGADEPYADAKLRLKKMLLDRGLDDSQPYGEHLSALNAFDKRLRQARKPVTEALQSIDVLALGGFFQYALDFKYLTVAHPMKAMSAGQIAKAPTLWQTRLGEELTAAGGQLGKSMKAMWPKHPFYDKARVAYARYRKYVTDGSVPGWNYRGTLKRKRKSKAVVTLRQRLAAEGYFDGDMESELFDEPLEEAVKKYQRHHQLRDDGIVRNSHGLAGLTKTSLAVGMAPRARQLKLTLQRWRESPTHRDEFYFRVNVPQFEVEVWDRDDIARTHRIIVGNNKFEVDEQHGRKGHLNRTALISNHIRKVVINPLWHVPERIKRYEIIPAMEKDPDYLAKHNYNVRKLGDGTIQVFQSAGPGNALGRVKLLFPNKHAIYMHDTPKRKLFRRTVRAFSHGCMRLQDPLDMATFLLERQGIMDEAEVQKILATKKERGVSLKEKVPIHIEYNTVAFRMDSPDPIFLNDVYKYDKAFWEGDLPLQREVKIPVVKREDSPLQVDDDGNLIVPEKPAPEEDEADPEDAGGPPDGDSETPDSSDDEPPAPGNEPPAPSEPPAPAGPAPAPNPAR